MTINTRIRILVGTFAGKTGTITAVSHIPYCASAYAVSIDGYTYETDWVYSASEIEAL